MILNTVWSNPFDNAIEIAIPSLIFDGRISKNFEKAISIALSNGIDQTVFKIRK